MKIISVDERLAEQTGIKVLLLGESGAGKTWQLRTLGAELLARTLFLDIEAGDLAIGDLPVATIRPRTWGDLTDLAVILGGANCELSPLMRYSEAHYANAIKTIDPAPLTDCELLFIDSITAASRLSFQHAEQSPEAVNDRGKKDLWSIYGLHARQMIGWLLQLQQARGKHVVLVGILEKVTDKFNHFEWLPQIEGSKTGRELPGIVDQIITLQFIDFGDGIPTRAFVCTSPNPWGFPAKDRSGKLDQIEEPHLGKLIDKLSKKSSPAADTEIQQVKTGE